jgi:hypothetical protein
MGVLTVVRVLFVALSDGIVDQGRNTFLSIVEVHETTNLALHVLLIAGILKGTSKLHGLVKLHEGFLVALELVVIGFYLIGSVTKFVLELGQKRSVRVVWLFYRKINGRQSLPAG